NKIDIEARPARQTIHGVDFASADKINPMNKLLLLPVIVIMLAGAGMTQATIIYEPYTITTIAGWGNNTGSTDGPPDQAEFNNPQGLAIDSLGNLYVVENGNHAIRKITRDGFVST